MSDQLLTILKFVLLALVWLFFLRVLRAVWAEVRRDKSQAPAVPVVPAAGAPRGPDPARPRTSSPTPVPLDVAAGPPVTPLATGPGAERPAPAPDPSRGPIAVGGAPNGAARGSGLRLHLSVLEPPELRGRSFDVADQLIVGRSSGCGVQIPEDNFVSHTHARFFSREDRLWVEDLGSTNGTYLNTRRLSQPAPLRSGDRLQMGKTLLEVGQ